MGYAFPLSALTARLHNLMLALPLPLAVAILVWVPSFAATPRPLTATVDRVADGDTVIATTPNGTKLRLRLLGIDAPEITHRDRSGQPYGQEAKDYLDHLIGGKVVRVEAHGPDQYKRVLAVLFDGQVNVNVLMVAMGYAEAYRGAPCQAYCEDLYRAEAKAKRDRVGIWAQVGKYESPGTFRRRMRIGDH